MKRDILSELRTTRGMIYVMGFLCLCLLVTDLLYPRTEPYTTVTMIFAELIGVVISLIGIHLIIVSLRNHTSSEGSGYKDVLILVSIALVLFGVTVIVIAYNFFKGG